jgi:DNA-binding MarR family transcriptional regulator
VARQVACGGARSPGTIRRTRIVGEAIIIDFSVLSDAIGYRLRRAQLAVFQDFSESFSAEGLRPADFSVILLISKNPGLKQSEFAEALGIQRANFVAIVDGLEARDLAERRKSETDRRVQTLYLTALGEQFARDMMATWRNHEERMIAKLGGDAERDQLIALVNRLTD